MSSGRDPSEDGADGFSGDNNPVDQKAGGGRIPSQAELDAEIAKNKAEGQTGKQVDFDDPQSQAG